MRRGPWAVMVVSGLLVLGACGGDDDSDGNGGDGGSSNAGQGASNGGSSGSTSSGSSGKGGGGTTGTGTGTNAGKGGSAAGSAASGGSAAGSGGSTLECDFCPPPMHCELVEVQCIRAPCPSQPSCVAGPSDAGSGGTSGGAGSSAGGSSAGSGKACGSRGLGQCADGEFCEFPMGADCGRADAPGTCAEQPTACTREYVPVCGCDGTTYSNKCEARAAGVSVETEGECGGSSSAGATKCVGTVTCHQVPSKCPDLQVHTIENGCYGPCVSIDECACSGPQDCPDENQYTCHMSAMHCGPYV